MQQIELTALAGESSQDGRVVSPPDEMDRHEVEEDYLAEDKPLMAEGTGDDDFLLPTEEELKTLPRVADKIPWRVYTVGFVELCERFSYYGSIILFQNFVQRSLLTPTGRAPNPGGPADNNPGALGKGQQMATGISTFFSFWCYVTPLVGAWLADTYLGR